MLKKVKNPILFQGSLNKKQYFEGWYYKQVSADQKTVISFIPGVSLIDTDVHSFIQYIWVQTDEAGEKTTKTGYTRYPIDSFRYQEKPFVVQIGDSIFTEQMISVDLEDDNLHVEGKLGLGEFHPIQTSLTQPNIMGFLGYVPKLECYHGVISMQHELRGDLILNGKTVEFTGGKGYLEKDWGTSFPKKYIWLHSNHFENPTASFFFSIADVPFHLFSVEGVVCNLVFDGKEYRFATYNFSRYKIKEVTDEKAVIRVENKKAALDIEAEVLAKGKLIAPVKGTMEKSVSEGVSGVVRIRLTDKQTGEVFEGTGKNAGVEMVGYDE